MASTIKATNISTPDGTGNITVDRPLSGSGASLTSLPAANLTGTLPAIDGSNLTGVAVGKNLIINGAMNVAQRGTSFAALASGYSLDRWKFVASSIGVYTVTQDSSGPAGFANSLKIDCTTADASPSGTDYLQLRYHLEGQDLQHLKKGTGSAESVTLSFWVKCNKTGNFASRIYDNDNDRIIGSTVTINSADTWEYKSITYAGDTTGALDDDINKSIMMDFLFDAGSTYTSGSVPTSWEAYTNADYAAGITLALADSTSNYINITGVKLEVGTSATDFEYRSIGEEILMCQRYYEVSHSWGDNSQYQGQAPVFGMNGASYGATVGDVQGKIWNVHKRAAPTVTLYADDGTSGAITRMSDSSKYTGVSAKYMNEYGFFKVYKASTFANMTTYYYAYAADAEL